MLDQEFIQEIRKYSEEIISELKKEGTDLTKEHVILHLVSSDDPEKLEAMSVQALKEGLEVTDPLFFGKDELLEAGEDISHIKGEGIYESEIAFESKLDLEIIVEQSIKVAELAKKFNVYYENWGTYLEDDEDDSYTNGHDFDLSE